MISARPPQETQEERIRRIAVLAQAPSFEITPKDDARLAAAAARLSPGTRIHITHLPGVAAQDVIASAQRARALGLTPVPHLAARNFRNETEASRFIARLAQEAQVRHVFLIGGDTSVAQGPFRGALDLLRTGALERHGIDTVGFGVYPEGHPTIADAKLEEALLAKLAEAKKRGLDTFLVTQFCFEAEPVLRLMQHLRALHVSAPLRIGVAGPSRPDTLLKFALRCGAGPSIRTLTKQGANIARLLAFFEPDRLVRAFAEAPLLALPAAGLHFYTLGGLPRAVAWAGAVAAGRIALNDPGEGFHVLP